MVGLVVHHQLGILVASRPADVDIGQFTNYFIRGHQVIAAVLAGQIRGADLDGTHAQVDAQTASGVSPMAPNLLGRDQEFIYLNRICESGFSLYAWVGLAAQFMAVADKPAPSPNRVRALLCTPPPIL